MVVNEFIRLEFLQGIQLTAKLLLSKMVMNKRMALATEHNAPVLHLFFGKILPKPFITMATLGDQVMKGQQPIRATQTAYVSFHRHMTGLIDECSSFVP